jgi:L-alanine-DL-glutamate epimerase-like enolase superfamily enzyme
MTGSIRELKRIAELCELGAIRCALSNTAGSMVGDAAALHVAASTPAIVPLCELGEFETLLHDPFTGLAIDGKVSEYRKATASESHQENKEVKVKSKNENPRKSKKAK